MTQIHAFCCLFRQIAVRIKYPGPRICCVKPFTNRNYDGFNTESDPTFTQTSNNYLVLVPGIFVKIGWSVYGFLERLIHHILPPAPSILVHAQSFMVSRCIYVVTILNIPDLIKNNPMRTSDLAEKVKVHPDRLERVMTLLHSHGIFKRNRQGKWCNNRLTAYEKLLDAVRDDESRHSIFNLANHSGIT
ncbi:hypothetical protein BKA69DRAFT_92563 [Paraphysoderma sedebokerense]|nr:hypothetical protein BKA69DRAFT_92563 [Paraphysoderma sedebokerense]